MNNIRYKPQRSKITARKAKKNKSFPRGSEMEMFQNNYNM
jgi:hypothetical protein